MSPQHSSGLAPTAECKAASGNQGQSRQGPETEDTGRRREVFTLGSILESFLGVCCKHVAKRAGLPSLTPPACTRNMASESGRVPKSAAWSPASPPAAPQPSSQPPSHFRSLLSVHSQSTRPCPHVLTEHDHGVRETSLTFNPVLLCVCLLVFYRNFHWGMRH